MCEEVQNPHKEVPRAIVLSVVASGITGIAFLVPILFVLPNIDYLLNDTNGMPIGFIFMKATGSAAGGVGLLVLIIGVMLFAGIGALTASSRCVYAFARDGAIPGSQYWSKVHEAYGIPVMGLVLSSTVICLMGLIYFGSAAAFNAFTGATSICLSACFGAPVLISLLRGRKLVQHSPYSLGRWGFWINLTSVVWILVAFVLFCMPSSLPTTGKTMNYTSVVFFAFAMISLVWYLVQGRHKFSGPPVKDVFRVIDSSDNDSDDQERVEVQTSGKESTVVPKKDFPGII
jgi:amino acid transporter